jgi:uncharacterized protein (TIGR03118 family)
MNSLSHPSSFRPALTRAFALVSVAFVAATAAFAVQPVSHKYLQTNLVADVPGVALATDPALVNPWGLSRSAGSPWWVADNGTGRSTLYNGAGIKQGLVVTVPVVDGQTPPSAPTGTVSNPFSADFAVATGQPARFLFATEGGTIAAWNSGTTAVTKVNHAGWAIYKGLAIGSVNGANYLYAANFMGGAVEVFDRNYMPVNFGADAFKDWDLPAGYAPFNVQTIGDRLYVAYAKQDEEGIDEVARHGNGFVDAYTLDGKLVLRLHSGYWMNAPWGLVQAPANFGRFSNMVLVGMFGSGNIAAFDPMTGQFRGLLRGSPSRPLQIDGLWALSFGNGAGAGPVNTLYFTAGTDDEVHGLFGTITAIPPVDNGKADVEEDDAE